MSREAKVVFYDSDPDFFPCDMCQRFTAVWQVLPIDESADPVISCRRCLSNASAQVAGFRFA